MREYATLSRPGEDEFTEKRSRFVGSAGPIQNEEEARAFVADIRAKNTEARHVAFAYIVREGGRVRFSDDGEPSNTAGKPILEVMTREGITDCVCAVTRYFGGVLLGAAGLTRAYARAAKLAVDAAGIIVIKPRLWITFTAEYSDWAKIEPRLKSLGVTVHKIDYGTLVRISASVAPEGFEPLCGALLELTAGRARPQAAGEFFSQD